MILKLLRARLVLLLLGVILSFNLTAQDTNAIRINYKCDQISSVDFFKEIESAYPIKFYYDPNVFSKIKVSINVKNADIEGFMKEINYNKPWVARLVQSDIIVVFPIEEYALHTGYILDYGGSVEDLTITVIGSPKDFDPEKDVTVSGKVKDGATGDFIIGATIQIENTTSGASSDVNGNYKLTLKPGIYILNVSSVGYEKSVYKIKALSDGSLNMELFETTHNINEVSIYAQRADNNIKNSQMGMMEINSKDLNHLPIVAGDRDVLKSLTSLPGVQSIGEFGSGINVRGGGEDQNLMLIEGSPLFNTAHVFGLLSVINPDAVSGVTLYKGHIPANYGERVSSVMNIHIRDNNLDEIHAKGGVGIFNSRLMLEGAVSDHVTFKIGGRKSYTGWFLKKLPDYDLRNSDAGFYDLNGLLNFKLKRTHISLFGYYSDDFFKYTKEFKYNYGNRLASFSVNHAFTANISADLEVAYSNYAVQKKEFDRFYNRGVNSEIDYRSARLSFTYTGMLNHYIEFGAQGILYNIKPGEQNVLTSESLINPLILEEENAFESGIFVNDKYQINENITINAGLRFSYYRKLDLDTIYNYEPNLARTESTITDTLLEDSHNYYYFEPRFSVVFSLPQNNSIKLSFNRNAQYINLITHTSISKPDNTWKLSDANIKPVTGNMISLGYFQNFKQNTIEASIELYYKRLGNLIDYINNADLDMNPNIERDLINVDGYNYGAEIFVRKNTGKLQGSASCTFSKSIRKSSSVIKEEVINQNEFYPSSYDKPIDLYLNARYDINRRWAISGNFFLASGRPVNFPEYIVEIMGYKTPYYLYRNKYRLPTYHRLDVSFHLYESLRKKKKWKGNWTLTIMNLYGRKNAYSIYYKKEAPSIVNDYNQYGLYKIYLIGKPFPTLTYNFKF